MLGVVVVVLLTVFSTMPFRAEGARSLKWVDGVLCFSELESQTTLESETGNGPLYPVNMNFQYKELDPSRGVTVVFDPKAHALRMDLGLDPANGVAWGHMQDMLDKTGWIELYVTTTENTAITNDVKMFAAGFLEGILTGPRISQFYSNTQQLNLKDEANMHALRNVRTEFFREIEYLKKQTNINSGVMSVEPRDPYWKHVRYVTMQIWGIKDAYNFLALGEGVQPIDLVDMLMINSNGELPELMGAYTPLAVAERRAHQQPKLFLQKRNAKQSNTTSLPFPQRKISVDRIRGGGSGQATSSALPRKRRNVLLPLKPEPNNTRSNVEVASAMGDAAAAAADREWERKLSHGGRCSAFVRLAPENKDLYVGHTTWGDYSKMSRIFKYYNYKLPGASTMASQVAMSSYPGCVTSTDDFYMLNSGLVVTDTSLEVLNPQLYDRVTEFPSNPHIPNFMHIMACNRMSRTANQWTSLFSERNSGTNNAQWMILDYNRFSPGSPLPDNSLWVLEQVPGQMHKADMSGHLRSQGWWASFDRPYFEDIRKQTGHSAAEARYGALYSYENGPRATIFKRAGIGVQSLFDMRNLMDRNEYPNEGVLPNEPGHAISARMDLDPVSRIPNGGIDAKVTNRCLFRSLQCQAISGPSHAKEPVFRWKDGEQELFPGWPHLGLPDVWDYDWVQMTPTKALDKIIDVNQC